MTPVGFSMLPCEKRVFLVMFTIDIQVFPKLSQGCQGFWNLSRWETDPSHHYSSKSPNLIVKVYF